MIVRIHTTRAILRCAWLALLSLSAVACTQGPLVASKNTTVPNPAADESSTSTASSQAKASNPTQKASAPPRFAKLPHTFWWKRKEPNLGASDLCTTSEGRLFFRSGSEIVHLDATGAELWRSTIQDIPETLLVTNDYGLLLPSSVPPSYYSGREEWRPRIVRLAASGEPIWSVDVTAPELKMVYSAQYTYDSLNDVLYVLMKGDPVRSSADKFVVLAIGSDGRERWRAPLTHNDWGFGSGGGAVFVDGWFDVDLGRTPPARQTANVRDALDANTLLNYKEVAGAWNGSRLIFVGRYLADHGALQFKSVTGGYALRMWSVDQSGRVSDGSATPPADIAYLGDVLACGDDVYITGGYSDSRWKDSVLRTHNAEPGWQYVTRKELGGVQTGDMACFTHGTIAIEGGVEHETDKSLSGIRIVDPSKLDWKPIDTAGRQATVGLDGTRRRRRLLRHQRRHPTSPFQSMRKA